MNVCALGVIVHSYTILYSLVFGNFQTSRFFQILHKFVRLLVLSNKLNIDTLLFFKIKHALEMNLVMFLIVTVKQYTYLNTVIKSSYIELVILPKSKTKQCDISFLKPQYSGIHLFFIHRCHAGFEISDKYGVILTNAIRWQNTSSNYSIILFLVGGKCRATVLQNVNGRNPN